MKKTSSTPKNAPIYIYRERGVFRRLIKIFVFFAVLMFIAASTAQAQTLPEGLSIDNDYQSGQDGYYYVNMLSGFNKTKTITLPEGFTSSFKVYDDGGKNKYYSNNCGSKLILTAPTGYVLQLSGDITTELISDCLTVYDGNDKKDGEELLNGVSSNTLLNIPTIISSGNSMTLYFYSNSVNYNSGLDLTVKLIKQTDHNITINTATGGSVTCNKIKAKPGEIVTLTIGSPTSGYMLSDVRVVYGDNEIVPINWDGMNDNDVTFRMPTDAVTVTPIFTNNFVADNGLFLNMPSSGSKSFSIPTNVKSFKVYDNGGKYNNYSNNYNGLLTLTAPSGYVLQLFATVTTESDYDYLTVYDGNNNSATELLKKAGSSGWGNETTFSPIVSSGQSMTIKFSSDDSGICEGLDLTVIVAQPNSSPTSYIIRFNKNSDEAFGTMPVQTHKYNATSALTANSFERIGYAFAGWATSADGAVKYTDKAQVKNIVQNGASFGELFAKWIKTLSHSTITISDISDQTYTGEQFTPVVTVKDGNTTLTANTDYTVTLPEGGSINAGDYTITITGKGNYTGTVTKNFSIKAKTLISNNVSDIFAQTYTDSAIEPTVTVADGSKTLVKGTDYTVTYSDNTNVGTSAKATITGKDNYTGTVEKTFTINAKTLVASNASNISAQTYTGLAFEPAVTVTDGSKTLVKGTDYTVTYSNNTNAGTSAKATITGKGNYKGTIEKTFTINAKTLVASNVANISAQTYTGSAIEPTVTVTDGTKTLVEGTDYTVTYSDNTNIGTGKVTVTFKGNYSGEVVKEFTINPVTATDDILVNSNIKIWSFEKTIFVENASKEIVIVDMAGRVVKTVKPENSRIEIQLSNSGVYIVKTGLKTQKIIIQ